MVSEIINTEIGLFKIKYKGKKIIEAKFIKKYEGKLTKKTKSFVHKYFSGELHYLNADLKIEGTSFQKSVWHEISKIPYGKTKTYGEIAKAIGSAGAARAVANACGQNKLSIFIPCHRVVGTKNIGGYHFGIDKKTWLLKLENDYISK
ncbi:putative methylated-DNA-protein-cysteine methyltransferase [Cotonvirus japonicus]|uniref:Methylated-DNA-protein-cysteine methyltransferase n=1 Tax=Cotonvirus japonicus TaxID=2811091 RepID=A0ABM7NS06_9VIRU|nr:putative methylated-DNA-protein-cysteine methyltransferase [Cotonvirus japonicus]BCS82877.1 putative methylated-DNA-protein-cysteine methyltransferase [Cotonvirus japonicus]